MTTPAATPREHQIDGIVRRVLAQVLEDPDAYDQELLLAADPGEIGRLRPLIQAANKAWEKAMKVISVREDSWYWRLRPKLKQVSTGETIVEIRWGFRDDDDDAPVLKTAAADAYDFALEVLDLFRDADGQVARPPELEHPEWPEQPQAQAGLTWMAEAGHEFLAALGTTMERRGGFSLFELQDWAQAGRPNPVIPHDFEDFPEDGVRVCRRCGHWTDGDTPTSVTCTQAPLSEGKVAWEWSIYRFDPRRSPALRDAQRLEKLLHAMRQLEATPSEIEPLDRAHRIALASLEPSEHARYARERVGQG